MEPSGAVPPTNDMQVPDNRASHLQYLVVTILIALWQGMIGVLVKWSSWPTFTMVWGRCVVTIIALWAFARTRPAVGATAAGSDGAWARKRVVVWGSGALLAAHWITLFLGYRVANVGPVVVALCTFPVMAALVEPWFFGQRPKLAQLVTACIATAGVAAMRLLDDGAASSPNATLGILLGLCSAAFFTARSIIARKLLRHTGAVQIMHEQAIVVAVLLLPSTLLLDASHLNWHDLLLVFVLGAGFTAIPHTLGVWSMKKLTVATSGVVSSLQTVSTVLLAQTLIGEAASAGVWLGAAAVMLAVAAEAFAHTRERTS